MKRIQHRMLNPSTLQRFDASTQSVVGGRCHPFLLWFQQHRQLTASFFFNDTAPTEIYTLSLHDALPICPTPMSSPSGCLDCWECCSTRWAGASSDRAAHRRGAARCAPTFRHACSAWIAMRVISLLPAATEIVAALGGLGRLVGVTHECDYPPEVRADRKS